MDHHEITKRSLLNLPDCLLIGSFLRPIEALSFACVLKYDRDKIDVVLQHFTVDSGDVLRKPLEDQRQSSFSVIRRRPLLSAIQSLCTLNHRCDDEIIELLLDHGADVNAALPVDTKVFWGDDDSTVFTATQGSTSVHLFFDCIVKTGATTSAKRKRCLQLLLQRSSFKQDKRGLTPLHTAVKAGDVEMASMVVNAIKMNYSDAASEIVDVRDYHDGKTAIMLAAESHNLEMVEMLLKMCNPSLSISTIYRNSNIFHLLFSKENFNLELRYRENEDIKNIDRRMRTMLELLINYASVEVLDSQDSARRTALSRACQRGFYEIAEILIAKGVNCSVVDQFSTNAAWFCLFQWDALTPVSDITSALRVVELMCVESKKKGTEEFKSLQNSFALLPPLEEIHVNGKLLLSLGIPEFDRIIAMLN